MFQERTGTTVDLQVNSSIPHTFVRRDMNCFRPSEISLRFDERKALTQLMYWLNSSSDDYIPNTSISIANLLAATPYFHLLKYHHTT